MRFDKGRLAGMRARTADLRRQVLHVREDVALEPQVGLAGLCGKGGYLIGGRGGA